MMRFAVRSLLRSPGFTVASILALALGIGANTAIFSLLNTVLLRPLAYQDAARLAVVWQQPPGGSTNDVSPADFLDWRERSRSFEHLAAVTGGAFNLTEGDRPERVFGMRVSADFFATLGVRPALGRGFGAEEEQAGADRSVVLSDALWAKTFGRDPGAIGKTIHLDRRAYVVSGVMPAGFEFEGRENELWLPLTLDRAHASRNYYNLETVARLRAGVTMEGARAEMDSIARQLAVEYPKTNRDWGASVVSLQEMITGKIRPALIVLMGAVACVLLIACANVVNLLLVRATGRRREFAIRAALGGGRGDIVKRLLPETLLLATAGGALGVLLAEWILAALVGLHPANIPRIEEVSIDWRVLVFTTAISLACGVLFALAPAAKLARVDVVEALKEGSRGASEGRRGGRMRNLLVVAEVALSMMLLIGAGLLIRSFATLAGEKTGLRPENLWTMNFSVAEERYQSEQQMAGDFARIVERVKALPGVVSAAAVTNLPVGGWNQGRAFTVEGRASSGEVQGAGYMSITPEYFRTAGIPLIRGRAFTDQDRHGAPEVVIISESMARRYWPGEDPIGRRVVCASRQFQGSGLGPQVAREIVGIAGDVRHVGREAETSVEMYTPQAQNVLPFTYLIVRTDPGLAAGGVVRAVNEVLKDSAVVNVKTLEDRLAESYSQPKFQMIALGAFAGLALLLATIGIYGVMAYSVAQRTAEIGIRMALGADASSVLSLVLGGGLRLAVVGVALGVAGAVASGRVMAGLLYGVSVTDGFTFVGVALLLVFTAGVASFVPAWRASRMDPARSLRDAS